MSITQPGELPLRFGAYRWGIINDDLTRPENEIHPPSDNPYVGPRTFTRAQAGLFFGREQEAEELFSRVVSQRLVLFYAQSGAGKSSLINTQLIPKLEEAGFVVLPVGRVGGDLLGGVDTTVDNIYLFNLMLSLDQSERDPARLAHLTLPDFLAQLTTEDGATWYYEESEGDVSTEALSETSASPVESLSRTPAAVSAERRQGDGETISHSALPNYVLIIDQFEEIITTHGDRWTNRAAFFQQLEAAMVADSTLWVVLTLREDFVASLDPYAPLLSDKLRARYYMQRMTVEAARNAIIKPAAARNRQFQASAVDLLLSNLSQVRVAGKASTESGQYIEPVQLQVVCYQLWEGLKGRLAPLISTEDVEKAGDVDRALASFYEETIVAALREYPLGGGERRLRRWFEQKLVTEAGTRGTVYQGDSETAGLPNEVVLALANRFLLRSEARSGGRWVELTHDRFVQPIIEANRAWEARQNNPLTAITRLWRENGRDPARLLKGQQLIDAQSFAREQNEVLSDDERNFLEASVHAETEEQARMATVARQAELARLQAEAEDQRRRARNLRSVITVVTGLALLALLATGWAFWQSRVAQQNANQAATAEAQSQHQAESALQAKGTAEAAKLEADSQRSDALIARATAEGDRRVAQQQAAAAATAQAQADAARQESEQLKDQLHADQLAQAARLVGSEDNLLQRGLLLAVAASDAITPPLSSAPQALHALLGRIGGQPKSGHEHIVLAVAFSPDGKTLASGSADKTIRLWQVDKPSADPIILRDHENTILAVAFSPDGKTLASGSADKTIRLWQVDKPSADPIILRGHEKAVRSVAFSPDGKTLASGSDDKTIRLWQVDKPSADLIILRGHEGYVWSVAFSPDGKTLASGSDDKTIRLWQVDKPSADPIILRGHENPVYAVAFSPDGKTLASGSDDKTIRLWQVDKPSADPIILRGHENSVIAVAFSPDGKTLASGSADKTIRLWQVDKPSADPIILRGHEGYVWSVAFSPDGKTLASGSNDKTIRLWQVDKPSADPIILRGHEKAVRSVAFSPDGKTLASGSADKTIRLWQVDKPSADPIILRDHENTILAVAFSPDGKTLASGSADKTIRLWQVDKPSADPIILRGHEKAVRSVAFSPDGKTLASGSDDKTIRLWQVDKPSADLIILRGHEGYVWSVAFSPDGKTLASGSDDKTIRLWQVDKPSADPIILRGHENPVYAVAFSPDGKTLASGSDDKTIRLWQVDKPSADPIILRGHENPVYAVAFSPDGKTLASGSADKTIRLWQVDKPSADPIILRGHENPVYAVAFSPDGKTLASGSADNMIRLWRVALDDLRALACAAVGRNFSRVEWAQYFPGERYRRTCPQWPDGE